MSTKRGESRQGLQQQMGRGLAVLMATERVPGGEAVAGTSRDVYMQPCPSSSSQRKGHTQEKNRGSADTASFDLGFCSTPSDAEPQQSRWGPVT